LVTLALCLALASPLFAQKKEDERLANSATAMQAILSGDKGLPTSILDKADCIVVFPSVKKVAIGIGGSYGRGVMVCRKGASKDGSWGAPAMYKLDQGSIGVQLGSTATDFVLVVMNEKGAEQILNGKTKLGRRSHGCCRKWLQRRFNEGRRVDLFAYQGLVRRRFARRRFDGNR
jgi:lipid-binding SYLF domain-containing protein